MWQLGGCWCGRRPCQRRCGGSSSAGVTWTSRPGPGLSIVELMFSSFGGQTPPIVPGGAESDCDVEVQIASGLSQDPILEAWAWADAGGLSLVGVSAFDGTAGQGRAPCWAPRVESFWAAIASAPVLVVVALLLVLMLGLLLAGLLLRVNKSIGAHDVQLQEFAIPHGSSQELQSSHPIGFGSPNLAQKLIIFHV